MSEDAPSETDLSSRSVEVNFSAYKMCIVHRKNILASLQNSAYVVKFHLKMSTDILKYFYTFSDKNRIYNIFR